MTRLYHALLFLSPVLVVLAFLALAGCQNYRDLDNAITQATQGPPDTKAFWADKERRAY